jgi:aminopeptidase N
MLLLLFQLAAQAPVGPDTSEGAQQALRYDITLVPSDTSTHILGEVETTWRLRSAAPVAMLLDSTFRVIRVLVDGKPNTRLSRTMYGRTAKDIVVPHEKQAGDTITTRVRYHGLVTRGFRLGPNRFGDRTAFSDSPPGPVSGWLPVPDDSTEAAPVSFNVQADSGQQVIANGTLDTVDTLAYGHLVWHYRLAAPVPLESIEVGVARFARAFLRDSACGPGCPRVSVWTFPRDSGFALSGPFRRAGVIAGYLTRLLGPFPYPELAHVESTTGSTTAGGGGVLFYGEAGYDGRALGEPTVAVATARQWFEGALPVGKPSLLLDGLGTYLTALWLGHADGAPALIAALRAAADSTTPDRGLWLWRQLHGMLGDSAFFAGLRGFAAARSDSLPPAERFARSMSAAAGRDLSWYFRQTVDQPGHPRLELRWRRSSGKVLLQIRQVQPRAWGLFRIPGLVVLADGRPVRVDVDGPVTERVVEGLSRPPHHTSVDPGQWWLLEVVRTT